MAYLQNGTYRTQMLHREIATSMQKRISRGHPISQSAALGLIQKGDRAGQYRGKHLHQLLDLVGKLKHQEKEPGTKENEQYNMTEDVFQACQGILLNQTCKTWWQRELQQYGPSALRPMLNYRVFDGKTYEIIEEWNGNDAEKILEDVFAKPSKTANKTAVYIDTEGSLEDLSRETFQRLALITLCDPMAEKVLLWRVDDYSDREMALVREALHKLSKERELVVFGHEELLSPKRDYKIPYTDIQRPYCSGGDQISLKKLAQKFGIRIEKAETISDWTRNRLTEDQKQYASMDALVLHYIYTREQCKKNLQRKEKPIGTWQDGSALCEFEGEKAVDIVDQSSPQNAAPHFSSSSVCRNNFLFYSFQ